MSEWPTWLGDIPTWLTTAAIGLAGGQFIVERRRRAAEEEREAKRQATQLIAWVVTDVDSEPRVYGVRVSNGSTSTFHDVCIRVKIHGVETPRPIELDVLPPGQYFIAFNGADANYTWDFAVEVGAHQGWLRPYMNSAKYLVTSLDFSDSLDQAWRADSHAVLSRG